MSGSATSPAGPHPLFDASPLRVEHWSNAVDQAATAAATLLGTDTAPPQPAVPSFWSDQFDVRIRAIGLPAIGTEFTVTEGSLAKRRFVASYHSRKRLVGAITFNLPQRLAPWRQRMQDATATAAQARDR